MKLPNLFQVIIISCLLLACGTEVGNGRAGQGGQQPDGTATPTAKNGAGTPETAPTSGASSPDVDTSTSSIIDFLFVNCASPLSEISTGEFVAATSAFGIKVTSLTSVQRQVAVGSRTVLVVKGTGYSIVADPIGPALSCGAVQTTSLGSGKVEREVAFSSGAAVSWQVEAGEVTSIAIRDNATSNPFVLTRQAPK